MSLNEKQEALCREHQFDFSGLSAVFLNCTLKPTGTFSHTEALLSVSQAIMDTNGVQTEMIRPVDYDLAPGVYPDMTEHGFARDDWPGLCRKVLGADILVVATPIWLGEESSVCRRILERLYSESGKFNDKGQYLYYGRAGGCVVTGNEDGAKHCAMTVLYALQHLGYVIPPQADAAWLGEAGPGPSYGDEGSGGMQNDFTQRNIAFMSWNLMHLAQMLKNNNGIPAHGSQPSEWNAGCRFDNPNPDYR